MRSIARKAATKDISDSRSPIATKGPEKCTSADSSRENMRVASIAKSKINKEAGETGLSSRAFAPTDDDVMLVTESSVQELLRSKHKLESERYLESEDWGCFPPPLFGIDFGTSNSVVSLVTVDNPQGVRVWKTANNEELRPTVVGFYKKWHEIWALGFE